jgi:hypothetical protein
MARNATKVSFLIAGFQKCGTTSLADAVAKHPKIEMCSQKEPGYFNKKNPKLSSDFTYHELFNFENARSDTLFFEATTSYSWVLQYPNSVESAYKYNPDMKLIFVIRDPIKRIESQYRHEYLKAQEARVIDVAVTSNPSYISRSMYYMQISWWRRLFPVDNILIIKLEDLKVDPERTLRDIWRFLDLQPIESSELHIENLNKSLDLKKPMAIKRVIAPLFRWVPLELRLFARRLLYSSATVDGELAPHTLEVLKQHLRADNELLSREFGVGYNIDKC